ncbi:hypothetical protein VaNZ11_001697 [Volvox africanus]|uniref:Uncharacterized protein n=1 Tax=Volvox africanus TaxID=51714 RepID=A0ABQ5RQ94_9CHLO|nr:hypothetical protein VaNZ11_001697 [Volvox africanus]
MFIHNGNVSTWRLWNGVGWFVLLIQAFALAHPAKGPVNLEAAHVVSGSLPAENCQSGPPQTCTNGKTAATEASDVGLDSAVGSIKWDVYQVDMIRASGASTRLAAAADDGMFVIHGGASTDTTAVSSVTTAAATDEGVTRRRLLTSSTISNGSASATFLDDAFATWCASDATCAAVGSTPKLSLAYYTNTSPFTSITLNWPNIFSGAGVSSLQLISGVVEIQLANYTTKQDQVICDNVTSCTAQLTIPLNSSADLTQSFVCLRLEPSVTGNSYQAYGYPPGSYGTSLESTAVNGAMRCNTTRFGKHVIMQYKQSAVMPPSPPSPPSPPPSPPLSTVGETYTSDVALKMTVLLSLGFDKLAANATLLSGLTSSLESSLVSSITSASNSMLLLPATSNISRGIRKISRASNQSTEAVSVEFRLLVPAGATTGQVQALMQLLSTNTSGVFSDSPYISYFTAAANVSYISSSSSSGLSTRAIIAIAVCCAVATLLLIAAVYGIYRWRTYTAILPKKPDGPWDVTGVAATLARTGRRRKVQQAQLDATPDAAVGLPPSPPLPTPPPTQLPTQQGGPAAEGHLQNDFPWEGAAAGGVAGVPSAVVLTDGGDQQRVKSKAKLTPPIRDAWS